ncbi:MAG: substrate-binding domain-containing protein [Pirellulales bacterium]
MVFKSSPLTSLAITVLCAALVGCGSSGNSGSRRIAVIPKGTTHDFWKSVKAGALKAGEEFDVEIIWKGTADEKDKEGQINLVNSFVVDEVDGICLAPIDRTALVGPIAGAKQAGIPTVIFDSGLEDASVIVSYVATNNRKGGELAGEHMAKLLGGKGNVILLRYAAGSESTEQREEGFLEALAKYPDIKVISDNQRAGSKAEVALETSTSLLETFGDRTDGIFTVCEPNNKGMLQALENDNRAGKIMFIGFDTDPRFVAALKAGTMHGIVLQDPFHMGYQAVKTMVEHLDGKEVEKVITTGEYLATADNMEKPKIKELLAPPKAD